jgi:hypothetical protein
MFLFCKFQIVIDYTLLRYLSFRFLPEIDHASMTVHVTLASIVHALSIKHIVGILVAVPRRVSIYFIVGQRNVPVLE